LPAHLDTQDKRKFLSDVQNFYWDDPDLFKYYPDQIFQKCIPENEVSSVIKLCHSEAYGGHFSSKKTAAKILQCEFYWPTMFKDTHAFCKTCENCQKLGFISKHKESLDNLLLTLGTYLNRDVHRAIHDLWPHFRKEHARHSLGNLTKEDLVC
jgi:phosphopantetheinyl transferase (holo-ACP synthase)